MRVSGGRIEFKRIRNLSLLAGASGATIASLFPGAASAATYMVSNEIELTAVQGPLSLNARQIFTNASESLVQTARSYIGQVEQFLLNARQLLRLHGEQTMITARQDAKIDAERISLG